MVSLLPDSFQCYAWAFFAIGLAWVLAAGASYFATPPVQSERPTLADG